MTGDTQAAASSTNLESEEATRVLRATLDVPIECAFTRAGAMNGLPTYPVPPIPTLQGMLYAALGRPSLLRVGRSAPISTETRDEEEAFRDRVATECSFGIRVVDSGRSHTGLRKRHKSSRSGDDKAYLTYVAQAETLISPTYRMYVTGPDDLLDAFEAALLDPERLLYLGRSDDIVDIRDVETLAASRVEESASVDCVIPGAGEDPSLLPVEPDHRSGRSTAPARVETVSVTGGAVDQYYELEDGDRIVFIT